MIYTQSDLISRINEGVHGKIDMLISKQDTVNDVVRAVINGTKLASLKRKYQATPGVFSNNYEYVAPDDLQDNSIIEISSNKQNVLGLNCELVVPRDFKLQRRNNQIAIDQDGDIKKIYFNTSTLSTKYLTILSSNVLPTATGVSTNFLINSSDYVLGQSTVDFDITSTVGTSAGAIFNLTKKIDISSYIKNMSYVTTFLRLGSVLPTSISIKIGTDSNNYYLLTATAQNTNQSFQVGWNFVRFDFINAVKTGTSTDTNIVYVEATLTIPSTHAISKFYGINDIVLSNGESCVIRYYSSKPWVSILGVRKENSTSPDDYLVCTSSEYELFIKKGIATASVPLDLGVSEIAQNEKIANDAISMYSQRTPDESMLFSNGYYQFTGLGY